MDTQDHTLKNHWVSKKIKVAPYLAMFLLLTSRDASEHTWSQSLRRPEIQPSAADSCNCWSSRAWPLPTCRIHYQKASHVAKCEVRKWTGTVCNAHQSHPATVAHCTRKLRQSDDWRGFGKVRKGVPRCSAQHLPRTGCLAGWNCICASYSSVIFYCKLQ